MNEQHLGEHVSTSEFVEEPDKDMNSPVVDSDPIADKVPADAALIHGMPMGGTDAAVGPTGEPITPETPIGTSAGSSAALLDREESELFRARWIEIQGKFVDEPRSAVQQADALVSEVIEQITQMFAKEHSSLESQWTQGNDVSTEDLRKALQHYRSFFNRLVV